MFSEQKQAIANAFGKAALSYDASAEFQRRVGHALLDRLPYFDRPQHVIDVGCGTGYFSSQLRDKGHNVTCVDLSQAMLDVANQRCGESVDYLQADAENLPLPSNSIDIAFSSLALQWCSDLSVPLQEMRRVVRPGGIIAFTTLVDGSLKELSEAWASVDSYQHINEFLSEKLIKVALAQAGLSAEPVEFVPIVQYYASAKALMRDLKGIGANHVPQARRPGLSGRRAIDQVEQAYQQYRHDNNLLPATYQVCFGVIVNE
ncbi:malonyl-ACP O-methyltransferase BioC [Thaumasiovibrio subtropicus]|uniref:malonyl-ACP O-methyltransferase BioC n=1 Tax=Thaumasiovibrio subtropicus TaxID=1891207 RepID=UPI000B352C55|nr:malonyl-ACP O-methyltransferase BioC [Thaumasiovibrio subtropicus]